LLASGFTITDLKEAGVGIQDIYEGAVKTGAKNDDLGKKLKDAGFDVKNFMKVIKQERKWDTMYLRYATINVNIFDLKSLKAVGFTISELIDGNYNKIGILMVFSINELEIAIKEKKVSLDQLIKAGFELNEVKKYLTKEDIDELNKKTNLPQKWKDELLKM